MKAMDVEHTSAEQPDTYKVFTSSNGVTTTSALEWEFCVRPDEKKFKAGEYPERKGFPTAHPEWCRKPRPLAEMREQMETHANQPLRSLGHSELIDEELVAIRLYTGPMYQKYNAVLRAKSGNAFLVKQWKDICIRNNYVSTIHAINSAVIKLSKLSKAGMVYRGVCYGKLDSKFWSANADGVCGGVEFGFQSTTRDRTQAVHYATGCGWAKQADAMTIFEMQMGMIDRGAELGWVSMYPHEKECLFPPLTGVEALRADVDGMMLNIKARMSINLSAQTLEQVLSRRRKMLMDMADGIELELREQVPKELLPMGLKFLRKSLEHGAYKHTPEWFNNDDNFAKVMQETLYLQSAVINEVKVLSAAIDKPELKLRGWKARGPARIMLLTGWLHSRTSPENVLIDLRECELLEDDAVQLAQLMASNPLLNAIDARGNDSMGDVGSMALGTFMESTKKRASNSEPRSISGVTNKNSQLQVPKQLSVVECRMLCAELEASTFAEGVSAGMGATTKGTATLNRRGGSASSAWSPLHWAAKDNNLVIAEMLIDKGHDVNKQEPLTNKALNGYAALHWAAHKGHLEMCELLLSRGANPALNDKHSNTAKALAEKKGEAEVVSLIESYMGHGAHPSGAKGGAAGAKTHGSPGGTKAKGGGSKALAPHCDGGGGVGGGSHAAHPPAGASGRGRDPKKEGETTKPSLFAAVEGSGGAEILEDPDLMS
eukprot:CAMPEP_0174755368 /NCGR_PEP_ID=MMETSP1094-20130205/106211_1 /TAXON_ID=156173 /ORGANISM="Chrysochromulina brevifilum, Strain UTEX LB 985" /LENGTH=715 /DNA_ID=CAMNT_0015961257 /DNA_START=10 /DNA_END=2157 /DNA_ORIENTATION=+